MAVRVNLAGRLQIQADGRTLDATHLPGRQGRVLLAYLVAEHGRPVPSEELAEALWGPAPPVTWRPALRGVISKVRAFLEAVELPADAMLTSASGCYQLTLPPGTMVDLELAAGQAGAAERALDAGDPEGAMAAAGAARALADQPLLPSEDGAWLDRRRAALREVLVRSLELLVDAAVAAGRPAVPAAVELVALEPFRESAHLRLLRAHAAAGDRGEALRAYDRCRRLLADELGIDPSPELETAYLDLLHAAFTPGERPAGAGPSPGAVVGRGPELARLWTAWGAARAGRRRAVLVGGEAGIGKSTLVAELGRLAEGEGVTVLSGYCDERLGVSLLPFRMALGRYLAACPPDLPASLPDPPAGQLARLWPELAGILPDPPGAAGGAPKAERYLLFEAVADLLEAIAATGPVLLVIEDLHRADEPSLLLLRHLLQRPRETALLVVATYLDDPTPDPGLAAGLAGLLRVPGVEALSLGGLDAEQVAALADAAAGRALGPGGTALARLLRDRTGGNPFYVGELLRHLAETGGLAGPDAAMGVTRTATGDVPEGVRLVVGQRLARLDPDVRQVLDLAAVIGQRVDLALLDRVVDLGDGRLLPALEAAVGARLLDERPDVPGGYRFHHAIVRDVVYADLPAAQRGVFHSRVGEALEGLGGRADRLGELADHFGLGRPEDAAKAVAYARRAGERARAQLLHEEAAHRYGQALAAMDRGRIGDDAPRCDLLLALAEAWVSAGQAGRAAEAQLAAVEAARSTGLAHHLARAALSLGGALRFWSPEVDRTFAIGVLRTALAAVGEHDSALRALLLARLAGWQAVRAIVGSGGWEAWPSFGEAVDLARRVGDRRVLAAVLADQGSALASVILGRPGGPADAVRAAAELEHLATELDDDRVRYAAAVSRAEAVLIAGDLTGLDRLVEREEESARARRSAYLGWLPAVLRTARSILRGRFAEGERLIDQALGVGRHQVGDLAIANHAVQLVFLRWLEGRTEAFEDLLERKIAEGDGSYQWPRLLPLAYAPQGREREARRDLEGIAGTGFAGQEGAGAGTVLALVTGCVLLGQGGYAASLYELLSPWQGWHLQNVAVYLGSADHHLGMLAATAGNWRAAERHLRTAMVAHHALGARPWEALTQQAYAGMLRGRRGPGDLTRADRLDAGAHAAAAALGMELPGWGRPVLGPRS
jgi:DNA-binding SARP family transcriptional activator